MSYNSDLTSSYLDSFTIEELNLLLRKYRQSIKKIMDKIRDKQRDIYETENFRLGNLISIEMNLLNNLGFVSNQIYKDEANLISKKFGISFIGTIKHRLFIFAPAIELRLFVFVRR